MKRLIIPLLFICLGLNAQIRIVNSSSMGGGSAEVTDISDDFDDYSATTLAGQGLWVQELGTIAVYKPSTDGEIYSNSSGAETAAYYNAILNEDQGCQATVTAMGSTTATGLAVRVQGSGDGYYYGWYSTTTQSYLFRVDAGSFTSFATGTAWSVTDVVRLEISGFELSCYRNGTLDTSVSGDGKYTDSDVVNRLSGGYIGISGYSNLSVTRLDDYSGGEL